MVWVEVGVSETDEYRASLPPVYAALSVTDDAPVVIGKVEAGITVNMIVDGSVVETAVGVCGVISVINAIVFETEVGACSAGTLIDNSLVEEGDKGDSVAINKTDCLVLESEIGNGISVTINVVVPVLAAPVGDDVTFNLRKDSSVRTCAEVSISDEVSEVEGAIRV